MGFGIKNILVEANDVWGREYQVEIFQRLRCPETLQRKMKDTY